MNNMFVYLGDILHVQFYDLTDAKSVLQKDKNGSSYYAEVGNIISEVPYSKNMFLPPVGTKVRFNSGKYNGIYKVLEWVYSDSTKLLRIKIVETL